MDLFSPQGDLHRQLHQRAVVVAMLDQTIPIVSATDLMVLKMLYDWRKDWADIEELLRHGSPDVEEARDWLLRLIGPGDGRENRLDQLLSELG